MQVFDSQSSYLPVKEQPDICKLDAKVDILSTRDHVLKDCSEQDDIIVSSQHSPEKDPDEGVGSSFGNKPSQKVAVDK